MIIRHNSQGLFASNRIKNNSQKVSKSINKLSSGLRINIAADDAAGLTISEKMRAQIRGLSQAGRNIQDGISLVQTAEASLGLIQNPNLQRLRELAIQAANGTLTSEDRSKIQDEIEQIKKGIDDIATHTEFNNIKVLRPPIEIVPPTTVAGKTDIIFIVDVSGSMGGIIDNVISNLDSFVDGLSSNGVDFNLGLVSYSDINIIGEPLKKWGFTTNGETFKSNMITMRGNMLGGGDYYESGLEGIMDSAQGGLSFPLRSDSSKQFILVTDAPVHDNNNGDGGDGLSIYDIDDTALELASRGIKLTVVGPTSGETNTQLKRLSEPTGGNYLNVYGSFSTQLDDLAGDIVIDSGTVIEHEEPLTIHLQVGANEGERYPIKLFDARTNKLGIADIKVDPIAKALEALSKIDAAMSKVSAERSKFGAHQNALEHIYNNVSNYEENLQAAESRIRDVDMAKEMVELTKNNILQQASQAMLAQANAAPQGVLQLLR